MSANNSSLTPNEIFLAPEIQDLGGIRNVSKTFEQFAVLILDTSASMYCLGNNRLKKIENTWIAVREFIQKMMISRNAAAFKIACVNYSSYATVALGITEIQAVDIDQLLEPTEENGGGTLLEPALIEAKSLIDEFLSQPNPSGIYRSAVAMVLSDGLIPDGNSPTLELLRATPHVSITSTLFSEAELSDDDREQCESILRDIVATSPNHYTPTASAEELRRFFEASLSVSNQGIGIE